MLNIYNQYLKYKKQVDLFLFVLFMVGVLLVSIEFFSLLSASIVAFFAGSEKQKVVEIKKQIKEKQEFEKELEQIQTTAEKEINDVIKSAEQDIDKWLDS